jgi:hypothetical protein
MTMSSPARRIADIEAIARSRQPDQVPARHFFYVDLFQAKANYGGQPPDQVLADVEDVERVIRAYDDLRTEHGLDVIDLAIMISTHSVPDRAYTPSGIAGMIVHAFFHWDVERHGEDYAWRHQRSRGAFEGQVAGRLGVMDAV